MPCGRLRTGQARPSRKGRLFAALRRSGRDALVASGLCGVPGGALAASGLCDVPGGTRFRIDMHCSEVKSRTGHVKAIKNFTNLVANFAFLLDLLFFRVLSLLRTEFSFFPCLPQSSLCVSACSVLTNRRFFWKAASMTVWRGVFGGGGGTRRAVSERVARPRGGTGRYGRDKRGPPVWHRAISLRNSSAGSVRGVSARVLRAPGRQRESHAPARRDGADTAATSTALPCGAALFHFGTVPRGRYAACRRGSFARRPVVQLPPAWSALPRSSAACARRPILLSFTSSAGEPGLAGAWTFLLSRGEKGKTT